MATKKRKISIHKVYLLFVIILFGVFIYLYATHIYNDFFKPKPEEAPEVVEEVKLDEIAGYGYTLEERDSEYYEELFNHLNDVLTTPEIDYEDYAKTIATLFVIDYYTLSNKKASTDVGGIEFLYPKFVDNFLINAQENMYKTIQTDFDGDRTQKLPTVKSVTVKSIKDTTLSYNSKKYPGYKLVIEWEYENDYGYETKGTFNVIKIKDKLYIHSKTGNYS